MGNRPDSALILSNFREALLRAPGGKERAQRYWMQLFESTRVDMERAACYRSLWDTDGLEIFGRTGAICLATDALNHEQYVRLAAICLFGLELER